MTQTINPAGNGPIIQPRAPEKTETDRSNRTSAIPDVGQSLSPVAVNSTDESNRPAKDPQEKAADALQQLLVDTNLPNTRLRIDKDDTTGDFIYQTLDVDTGEVIKQFPPETIQEMLSKLRDVEGLAFDSRV